MQTGETWIERMAFAFFLLVVFSLGSMKPAVTSLLGPLTPTDLVFPFFMAFVAIAAAFLSFKLRWHQALWMLILFFLGIAIATVFSSDIYGSLRKLVGSGYLLLLAYLTFCFVTTSKRLRLTIFAWLAGAVIPLVGAVVAILLFYLSPNNSWLATLTYHYGAVPVGDFPRVSSTMISPSMLCNYLTVTLIVCLVAFRLRWLRNTVAGVLIGAIIFASAFTVSIALGGLLLAAGLWIWRTQPRTIVPRIALVAAAVAAFTFLLIAPFSINDAATGVAAPSSRSLVWAEAMTTFAANPLVGIGPGLPVAAVIYRNSDNSVSLLTDAHNTFLQTAAQTGVIGVVGLLAVIFVVVKSGTGGWARKDEIGLVQGGLTIAFVCAFIYDGLTGSFEDARHLWVLIGLILAVDRIPIEGEASLAGGG